jgi:hypothetical protein
MTAMAVVVGLLGIKGERMPSNGENLNGSKEMSKDSNHDNNCSSVGGVKDQRGDNAKK